MDGSSLAQVKAAVVAALTARLPGVKVSGESPLLEADFQTDDGLYESIYLGAAEWSQYEPVFLGLPIVFDEVYSLPLIIQVLRVGESADTQAAADARLVAMWGEVVGAVASDPVFSLNVPNDGVTPFWCEFDPPKNNGVGLLHGDGHGASIELPLQVHARLNLS
jgi:hypothetical protein